jgi:hypothetical protein
MCGTYANQITREIHKMSVCLLLFSGPKGLTAILVILFANIYGFEKKIFYGADYLHSCS